MLKKLYQGTRTLPELLLHSNAYQAFWMTDVDAMLVLNTTQNGEVRRVYRDGSSVHIAVETATPYYDQAPEYGGVIMNSNAYTTSYQLDPRTWTPNFEKPVTTEIGNTSKTVLSTGGGLFLRDRAGVLKYYQRFGQGYKKYDSLTGALEDTVTVFTSGSSPVRAISWLESQTVIFVRNDGSIRVYDLSTKTVLLSSAIDAPTRVAVDTKYKNIVSVRASDSTTQVYDIDIQPATVSSIVFTPNALERYRREDISVTVLGSAGEPVVNHPVEWSIYDPDPTENFVLYSEEFQQSSVWQQTDVATSNVTLSPIGDMTADLVHESSSTASGQNITIQQVNHPVSAGETHTLSVWLKRAGVDDGDSRCNLVLTRAISGTYEQGLVEITLTDSWVRYSVSRTWSFDHDGMNFALQTIAGGIFAVHIWGAQINEGSSPLTYIKTTDAEVSTIIQNPALGKISPLVSITDESGVARSVYCPPGDDWSSGIQETLIAKVYT